MLGIPGTGLYGQERYLADTLRADRQQLENAPLGPIQKKRLAERIADTERELKIVRAEMRAARQGKTAH
jgi:hypothetical protein